MTTNQVTGSKLSILKHCQWWARQEATAQAEQGAAASRGVGIHEAIEKDDLTGVAFEDIPIAEAGRSYIRELRAAGWSVELEVAMAVDPVLGTARRLTSAGHRDYSDARSGEVCFTVDYIATDGTVVEVGDWKTGYGAHVEKASENWQTGIAAWGTALTHPAVAEIRVALHFLDNNYVDRWTFDAYEISMLLARIKATLLKIPTAQPSPGDHCKYCPARLSCPAVQGALVSVAEDMPTPVLWRTEFVSVENDAKMAMHLSALKATLKDIEDALKERAKEQGGIPLPNGKVWRESVRTRNGYDTKRMAKALGPRAEEFATKTEYTVFAQVKP